MDSIWELQIPNGTQALKNVFVDIPGRVFGCSARTGPSDPR
jgi:hypothetical protein